MDVTDSVSMEDATTRVVEVLRSAAGNRAAEVAGAIATLALADSDTFECTCGGCDFCVGRGDVLGRLLRVKEALSS